MNYNRPNLYSNNKPKISNENGSNLNSLKSKENLPVSKVSTSVNKQESPVKSKSTFTKENDLPNSSKKRQLDDKFTSCKLLKSTDKEQGNKPDNKANDNGHSNDLNDLNNAKNFIDIDWDEPLDDPSDSESPFYDSSIENFKNQQSNSLAFDDILKDITDSEIDFSVINAKGFYGLPDVVNKLLKDQRKIDKLYDWQENLMHKLISHNRNLVYCVPTSGGKTLVAELMILREIMLNKKNALFVFPFVSIVKEKIRSLMSFALDLGFVIEEYANDRGSIPLNKRKTKNTLYIATIEKAHLILTSLLEEKRLNEIGLVVVDELHMLGDGSLRGCTLESLLVLVMLAKQEALFSARLIAMSATLSNFQQIEKFLDAEIVENNFRPVELKEYVKFNRTIFQYSSTKYRETNDHFKKIRMLSEPKKTDPDSLTALVEECMPDSPVLIFCSTKKNCENVVKLICSHLPKYSKRHKVEERKQILKDLEDVSSDFVCQVLRTGVPYGVVYHHSGLTNDEREIIESNFLNGNLNVIVCTSTLAAGVNLPAQRVIIRAPYVASTPISASQYKQMIGRAGRAGFGNKAGESILMMKEEKDKEWIRSLFVDVKNDCISSIESNRESGISRIFLSLFHLGLVKNFDQIRNVFINKTLFGIQFSDQDNFFNQIDDSMARFHELNLIERPENNQSEIKITSLGKGAVKGLIDVNKCNRLYNDLKEHSKSFNLNSKFCLFYICTYVFDLEELPQYPDATYLQETFIKLTDEEKADAKLMGITEPDLNSYLLHYSGTVSEKIKRFFLALIVYKSWKSNDSTLSNLSFKCKIQRGTLQQLFNRFSNNFSSLFRFVNEIDELWGLRALFKETSSEISLCSSPVLKPLLELPRVRIGRAKLLYNANYKDYESIARAQPYDLLRSIGKISLKECQEIIKFAKQFFKDKSDILKTETEYYSQLGD